VSKFLTSIFQVREARDFLFNLILTYFATVFMFVWLMCYYKCLDGFVLLFGYEGMAIAGRTMARPKFFAQATLSRLGETCRNRSQLTLELSLNGDLSF